MRLTKYLCLPVAFLTLTLSACASLPEDFERIESYAIEPIVKNKYADKSEFMLLNEGTDAFVARAVMAEDAKQTIDAQYYILYKDDVADTFLALLIKAADRGVRVRILLDDYLIDKKDKRLAAVETHPNMEVRLFHPFGVGEPKYLQAARKLKTITRRMHNKAYIVDNHSMVIGGRNIADEYFDGDGKVSYNDLDALTWGPVVQDISTTFDAYWNNDLAYPLHAFTKQKIDTPKSKAVRQNLLTKMKNSSTSLYSKALMESQFAKNLRNRTGKIYSGSTKVIADDPLKLVSSRKQTDLFLWDQVKDEFSKAEKEVFIITPYFVPTKEGVEEILALRKKGVKVKVFTNSGHTNNHSAVHAKYVKYRIPLLKAGVEIFEVRSDVSRGNIINQLEDRHVGKEGTLHTKAFIVDRKQTFIGSMNFDPRSVIENTEQGVIFNSHEMASDILKWFDVNSDTVSYRLKLDEKDNIQWETKMNGETVVFNKEPDLSASKKFLNFIFKLLPIEGMV